MDSNRPKKKKLSGEMRKRIIDYLSPAYAKEKHRA